MSTLKENINRAVIALHREKKKEWLSLKEIYEKVEEIRKKPNLNNGASIRASLETHCRKCDGFNGNELYDLKEKGTGLYKSIYYEGIMTIENIQIGEIFTRDQLMHLFKISGQSGIMKTNTLDALVLISSITNGVYDDSGIVDGKIVYTGEGLTGDQLLNKNNKTLYDSLDNNLYVYLFTKDEKRRYTFEGRVQLCDKPYQVDEVDADRKIRKAWKFPLQIIYPDTEYIKEDINISEIINEIEIIEERLIIPNNEDELVFKDEPLKIKKYRQASERGKQNRITKPDYIAEQIIKNKQGIINEETIFKHELNLIMQIGTQEQIKKMKEFYENKTDGEGYDILSYELNEDGGYIEKYIEVKSTKGNESTPIDITDNEKTFAEDHMDQYYIYRIIKSDSKDRYVKVVKGKDLFENYKFIPTMYKIYSK